MLQFFSFIYQILELTYKHALVQWTTDRAARSELYAHYNDVMDERDCVSNHQPHDCLLNHLFKSQIKENIKASRHWFLWGEFTGDRWIPRTKDQ